MAFNPPYLTRQFPSRRPTRLGLSPPLRVGDWLTRTWFRFNATALTLVLAAAVITDPALSPNEKFTHLALAPVAVVLFLPIWKLCFVATAFVPMVGVVTGLVWVVWYWTFSRLVVEPPPAVHHPLWHTRHG